MRVYLKRSIVRAAISTVIGFSVFPAANAGPVDGAAKETPAQRIKDLYTVPQDGLGDKQWLEGDTNLVRAILRKHPNQDVVICVAGCASPNRIVYAQPKAEPDATPAIQPISSSEQQVTPVASESQSNGPSTAMKPTMATPADAAQPAADAASKASKEDAAKADDKSAQSGEASEAKDEAKDEAKPAMEPAMAAPQEEPADATPPAATLKDAAPASHDTIDANSPMAN